MSRKSAVAATAVTDEESKRLSPTVLTAFLNAQYHGGIIDESNKVIQKVSFCNYPLNGEQRSRPPKNVIDVNDYAGVEMFEKLYNGLYNAAVEDLKDVKDAPLPKVDFDIFTKHMFDLKLRGILDIINSDQKEQAEAKQEKKDELKTRLAGASKEEREMIKNESREKDVTDERKDKYIENIVNLLEFPTIIEPKLEDYIKAIDSWFANEDKLKTRLFNAEFPHAVHDESKPAKGVNLIYLQHISKFHDDILAKIVKNGETEEEILRFIQKQFANNDEFMNKVKDGETKLSIADTQKIKLWLEHPEIVANVIRVKTSGSNTNDKWVESLPAYNKPGSRTRIPEGTLGQADNKVAKNKVREMIKELNIAASFIRVVINGRDANSDVDINECYESYTRKVRLAQFFADRHKGLVNGATFATFVGYFVEAVKCVKELFKFPPTVVKTTKKGNDKKTAVKTPLKFFMNDLREYLPLKLSKELSAAITTLVDKQFTSSDIDAIVATHESTWKTISNPDTYSAMRADIYGKLGKIAVTDAGTVRKDLRIALGLALTAYIQEQVKIIRSVNAKKEELVIFIKV